LIAPTGVGPYVTPNDVLAGGTPTFLGHTLKSPEPSYEQKWKPVFSSQSGEAIPADKVYQGTEVKIRLSLQRFDYDVIQALKAAPRYGRLTAAGTEAYIDIGALLQRNGLSFALWMRNEFYGTINAVAYPDLPIGTFFPCCNVAAIVPSNMTRDSEICDLLIEANWVQAYPAGARICFTSDPTYFSTLPVIG
jgi:hypothetical protein